MSRPKQPAANILMRLAAPQILEQREKHFLDHVFRILNRQWESRQIPKQRDSELVEETNYRFLDHGLGRTEPIAQDSSYERVRFCGEVCQRHFPVSWASTLRYSFRRSTTISER